MRMRVSIGSIVLSCLVSSVALAQPGTDDGTGAPPPPPPPGDPTMAPPPPAAPMPPPPPGLPAEPVSNVDKGIVQDANAGRMWMAPTALTEPAGTWSFSDYELLLVGLSYAVTDTVSISANTLLPIVEDMPFWMLLNGKAQIVRSGNVRLAVQGALTHGRENGEGVTAGILGGALSYCLDVDCHSLVNAYVGAGFAHEDQSAVPLVMSGSLLYRVSKYVKIMLEADTLRIVGNDINQGVDGFLAWYGVRFTSKIIGVDLGFVKPICTGDSDCSDGLVMGVPFVSFTYRSFKE